MRKILIIFLFLMLAGFVFAHVQGTPCEEGQCKKCVGLPSGSFAQFCEMLNEKWVWGACKSVEEICGNEIDDDCDGMVDEGCLGGRECERNAGFISFSIL